MLVNVGVSWCFCMLVYVCVCLLMLLCVCFLVGYFASLQVLLLDCGLFCCFFVCLHVSEHEGAYVQIRGNEVEY